MSEPLPPDSPRSDATKRLALEIRAETLEVVRGHRNEAGAWRIAGCSIRWRREAASLQSEEARSELAAAFREVKSRFPGFAEADAALSGDFCVTRVFAGSNEEVRHEMEQIESRSSLYLSLGRGPKALGGSVQAIDARHQHAQLTVVNQRTLNVILDAAADADLRIASLEPCLAACSRLVRERGGDEEPALIVNLTDHAAAVAITRNGQLLLDYRPAGRESQAQVAGVIARHLKRLERNCRRYAQGSSGKLEWVYLSGAAEVVDQVAADFEARGILRPIRLGADCLSATWESVDDLEVSRLGPALGMLIRHDDERGQAPNLLERIDHQLEDPPLPKILPLLWPAAAAVALGLFAWAYLWWENQRVAALEPEVARVEELQREVSLLRRSLIDRRNEADTIESLGAALSEPSWQALSDRVGECMPREVWLDSLQITPDGDAEIQGVSFSDSAMFEFVSWLEKEPALRDVALVGTRAIRLPQGPARRFNVQARLATPEPTAESSELAPPAPAETIAQSSEIAHESR